MKIAVVGLWHLGTVTAACSAAAGHEVIAIDSNTSVVRGLEDKIPPVQEPGLGELLAAQVTSGRLRFSSQLDSVSGQDAVWITFDTPVDENDNADVESVFQRSAALLPLMSADSMMLISSQVPVGTTARLEAYYRSLSPANRITFAYSPENLRLGTAIKSFMQPDRVIVGVRNPDDRNRLKPIWEPLTSQIEFMTVESAEMTKHAINAFLATSVSFINEIARISEQVGADALEVERGLKTDSRIGRRAYLHPGSAFAGGTLARDIMFLRDLGRNCSVTPALFDGVKQSNDLHQNWLRSRLTNCVSDLRGKTVAVLGLTYKPGTDTLRRSAAVSLCRWLVESGATVHAYDPAVREERPEISGLVHLMQTPEDTLTGAEVLLIATEWPEFRALSADAVIARMQSAVVLDPSGFLEDTLGRDTRFRYYAVGRSR